MAEPTRDLLGEAVAPIAEQLSIREQRALLAILERRAADSYRGWASDETDPKVKAGLLEAADNEDGIAQILEDLDPGYPELEADLHERFPQLDRIFETVLGGRPREEQLRLQQAAETGASGLFRTFADAEDDPQAKAKLMQCADTEMHNANFIAGALAET